MTKTTCGPSLATRRRRHRQLLLFKQARVKHKTSVAWSLRYFLVLTTGRVALDTWWCICHLKLNEVRRLNTNHLQHNQAFASTPLSSSSDKGNYAGWLRPSGCDDCIMACVGQRTPGHDGSTRPIA
jgi:hypothetical protein